MQATTLTLRGDDADRFSEAFLERKAEELRRSLNKRGVRNIHRFEGETVTQIAYERAAAHLESWLLVSLLVEPVAEGTVRVVVMVGGSGEGPFKLESMTAKRLLEGPEAVGVPGRLATVLDDVRAVCESIDATVEVEWESDEPDDLPTKLAREIFDG